MEKKTISNANLKEIDSTNYSPGKLLLIINELFNNQKNSEKVCGNILFWESYVYHYFSTKVNYSNMDFTVPIQKATEREIFDYIDLDNIQKLLNSLKNSWGETDNSQDNKTGESTMESEMTETELTQTDNTDASSTGDVQENEPILESTGVIDEFSLDETNESEKIDNSEINVKNENENISPELSQDKEYWQNLTENENTENNNEMKTDLNLED